MLEFFAQNWGTILIAAIVLAVCVIAAWKLRSDKKKGKSSCGGSCGCCPNASLCCGGSQNKMQRNSSTKSNKHTSILS